MTEINHRDVVAGLSSGQRKALLARSDVKGLRHLSAHWGLIVVVGALIHFRVPYWPVLLLVQGVLVIFVFTALHETIHKTAFKSEWLNEGVALICGFLIALPANWFRYFHLAHHRYTHDPKNDPELAVPKPETLAQYCLYLSGLPVWWSHLKQMAINAADANADAFVPNKGKDKVTREARLHILAYAALIAGSLALQTDTLLWIWVIPAIVGQPFLRAYLLAEHTRCPHVANMLENTRTTFTTAIVRFLAWNMPYHIEHHTYPSVPFHNLPDFHRVMRDHLKVTERGYVRFNHKLVKSFGENEKSALP